ncbi:MAG: hypothetical protein SV253_03530 [Halobacteria archaeon]|nr:hypothetical protein [Halobacteria archaeon]
MGGVSLPRGESLYGSLRTDFVDVDGLVEDLERTRLTGYVSVEDDRDEDVTGVFVFSDGDPVGGVYHGVEVESEDVEGSLGSLVDDGYSLRAVSVPDRLAEAVSASVTGDTVHESLHTDYVDPRGFFDDLEDEGFTGSVVLSSETDSLYGCVHLRDGEPFYSAVQSPDEIREGMGTVVEVMDDDSNEVLVDVYEYDHPGDTDGTVSQSRTHDDGYVYGRSIAAVRDSLSDVSGDIPFMTALEEAVREKDVDGVDIDGSRVVVDPEADPARVSGVLDEALESTEAVLRVTQQNLEEGEVRRRAVEALREETDARSNSAADDILESVAQTEG